MNIEQVREYTLSLPEVTEDQPFGDDVITYRIGGKIFLCLWLTSSSHDTPDSQPRFAIKLAPERNEALREQYTSVTPAWHWNKKHWSDIYYTHIPEEPLKEWINESYTLVKSKLPKRKP